MLQTSDLPALNASLNATTATLLMAGWLCIRRRLVRVHRALMLSAVTTSALFLTSYLVYHAQVGSKRFPGHGLARGIYLAVLGSHTLLAVVVVPLVLVTVARGLRGRFDRHRAIARWTLPLWLYVSVTGVAVYWMLYRVRW